MKYEVVMVTVKQILKLVLDFKRKLTGSGRHKVFVLVEDQVFTLTATIDIHSSCYTIQLCNGVTSFDHLIRSVMMRILFILTAGTTSKNEETF